MSEYKLTNFAFYRKLKIVEDLHIYEEKEMRVGLPLLPDAHFLKTILQQLNSPFGSQDSFNQEYHT